MANSEGPGRQAPQEVDAYLEGLPAEQCILLQKVREAIHTLAPGCTERVSYRIPIFRKGVDLVGLSAHRAHLSLHTMSPALAVRVQEMFPKVTVSGATVRFTPDAPLPREVLEWIIGERLQELDPEG